MKRMSSEEEQDVFEITDFTTASEWERFISRIEEVLHEWKLPQRNCSRPLEKGELSAGVWLEKREQLMFASFQFEATLHQLKTNTDGNGEGGVHPVALMDMMSKENDFPPKAHCLVRWYGLREFVTISPAKSNDAIMTEDRTKMLLSSVSIALNATNCPVPVFVQLQQMRQRYFAGVCEGGGSRTSFDMVHLHRPIPQHSHLSGLLSLFRDKCGSGDPVSVSIRFTYVLHDWSPCSWPQPPPEIDELGEDVTSTDIGRLPCGAIEDPVLEFHLSVTWPCLSEKAVIDNDVHSDLNPLLSPKWSMRMRTTEKPVCSMADYLRDFSSIVQSFYSENQLLGNSTPDDNDNHNITSALDKLASPAMPKLLPPQRPSQSAAQEMPIGEELLIKILQYIFPDSAPTPAEAADEWRDTVNSMSELDNTRAKLQLSSLKSSPEGSLTWRLCVAACHVHHACGGVAAVAQLWQDFLLEMRHRWENNYTLPGLDPGSPNMNYCLLHQKLQMLNCCIQRKKSREWRQMTSVAPSSESEEEDTFYECTNTASEDRGDGAEGRLRQLGEATLMAHPSLPLYIPITQDPAPVTEDALAEQADALVRLGEDAEGAALRARMQSACLASDMDAFKAANPKSSLEDFVRWYSPRDLIQTEEGCVLSPRMLLPGNMWLESWEVARPIPAHRQRRLFDDTKEAEKVLHFLSSAKTSEVVTLLMPSLVHCALLQLAEEGELCCGSSLPLKLEEASIKAAKVMRNPEPKYEGVLRLLYEAEVMVAQAQSVAAKFGLSSSSPDDVMLSFVRDLLDSYEVEVPGGAAGPAGRRIRQLFADAHKASQLLPDSEEECEEGGGRGRRGDPPFPPPSGKEFVLRGMRGRGQPQRLYAVVMGEEFRLCGAFTRDTTFL